MPDEPASTPLPPADLDHLRGLVIGHYVIAALVALVACLPLIHVSLGLLILSGRSESAGVAREIPALAGWMLTLLPGLLSVAGWALAGVVFLAGRALARRRRWMFCIVVDMVLAAAFMPLGTLLGVFTLAVLLRPQVKAAFGVGA